MRWLSEQLEAATTRTAQETDYMSAQLESERGRLATAQQESEQAAGKLEAAQAQITNQAAEFSARDAARSEQVRPANSFFAQKNRFPVPENLCFSIARRGKPS